MTLANISLLHYPRSNRDEAFWEDYLTVTQVWGNVTRLVSMEPDHFQEYELEIIGASAQDYAKTGLWPCYMCPDNLFPREMLDRQHRCPSCQRWVQEAQERNRELALSLNLVYPERKPLSPTLLAPIRES